MTTKVESRRNLTRRLRFREYCIYIELGCVVLLRFATVLCRSFVLIVYTCSLGSPSQLGSGEECPSSGCAETIARHGLNVLYEPITLYEWDARIS